ncbi:MAG: hypothetical protein K2Q03_07360 [Sphingobacteriaceae bacterium]|nr:hypothetical protein [Sphingobacteriaceae bacterium]
MGKYLLGLAFFILVISKTDTASAQCSMCTINAENSVKNGNTQGKGLNNGVLYLLAIPYVLITGVGFIWYKNYRKKTTVKNQIL